MTVKDEPPVSGSLLSINHEWIGRPKPKHIAEYRQWTLITNQFLADRWNQRILYCLGTKPNQTEFWQFEPGKSPQLVKKANIGIP